MYQYWTSRPRSPLQLHQNQIVFVYGLFFQKILIHISLSCLTTFVSSFFIRSLFSTTATANKQHQTPNVYCFFRMGLLNHAKDLFKYLRATSCRQDCPNPNRWPTDPSIPVDMRKFILHGLSSPTGTWRGIRRHSPRKILRCHDSILQHYWTVVRSLWCHHLTLIAILCSVSQYHGRSFWRDILELVVVHRHKQPYLHYPKYRLTKIMLLWI